MLDNYRFIDQLKALPSVEEIYLFGSLARGDCDDKSDIDLAIVCPSASVEDWNNIVEYLENVPVLNHIDAVRYDTLQDGLFKQQIDKYKQVLYAKD